MSFPVYIPLSYDSRYALLGAMARECASALAAAGCSINPVGDPETILRASGGHGLMLFFNFCSLDDRWLELAEHGRERGAHLAVVQFFVDHPLALDAAFMDRWARTPGFRMILPCPDGLHWMGMRFPWLRHGPCPHGIPESALCDESTIENPAAPREFDVVAAGSIHTQAEIDEQFAALPEIARTAARDMSELLVAHPAMSFEQALDLCLGQRGVVSGNFPAAQRLWRVVTAAVNRRRRVALIQAMQGRRTLLLGGRAWSEFASGTIVHAGDVAYTDLPAALARARTCIAWGPTQFIHGHSERLLLAMAAGCASASDDRLLVRRDFGADGQAARYFDAARPETCRAAIDSLLADGASLKALAHRGRELVAERHLWRNRLQTIVAVAQDTLRAAA